jgi:hypothetical protein
MKNRKRNMFEAILAEANKIDAATKKKIGNTERFMASINRVARRDHFGEPRVLPKPKPCRVCRAQLYTEGEKKNIPPLRYQKQDYICRSCTNKRNKAKPKGLSKAELFHNELSSEITDLANRLNQLVRKLNDSRQEAIRI